MHAQSTDHAARREHMRRRIHRYLNLPVALAAILFVLIAFTHISGTGTVPWHHRFWHGPSVILLWIIWGFFIVEFLTKLALSPHKPTYLRCHWFDGVVALLPVCGLLRLIEVLLISPLLNLLRGEEMHPHLAILAKRKLGKLALISVLVILIVACLSYIFENGVKGATINTFGDALWWAAATATTVGNQLYPVTIPGEILAFFLMLFAIGVFSYLTSSIASALIGGDAAESAGADQSDQSDASGSGDGSADGASGAGSLPATQGSGSSFGARSSAPQAQNAGQLGANGSKANDGTQSAAIAGQPSANGNGAGAQGGVTVSPAELAALRALLDRLQERASQPG